ncbi:hypothetical protein F5B21DRAFT_472659 [Xylaria acuta]|nr:hypothetical protein F5B21DRAFT_472659 [Xylaria acuta]
MGHLSLSMKSELLPSQKAIIAMSRERYLAYLRPSLEDGPQAASGSKCEKDRGETKRQPAHPTGTPKPADNLSVGVCIFRLNGQTLSPAVLLLRRSPRWWQRRIIASVGGGHGAGEWELPGGKVETGDFCISAAIERLVREKTGLRITKIMGMLSDVRWREELKVLLWEDEVGNSTSEDSKEDEDSDWDGDGDGDEVEIKLGLAVDTECMSSMESGGGGNADNSNGSGTCTTIGNGDEISSGEETLVSPVPLDPEALKIRLPADSSSSSGSSGSSGSSALRLTTDSGSSSEPAPPVPPKDPGRYARSYREHSNDDDDDDDDDDEYHADHERDNKDCHYHRYESDSDHDPLLKPAPLSLPSRKPQPQPPQRRRRRTASSTALPAASPVRVRWRDAQVIPYKMVRKEHVQLNFTVLVDEEEGPLPGFLRRHAADDDDDDGRGDGDGVEEDVYDEHDALEWATCARVEKMPMSEDLRRVVFEGLAWMGTLTGGFF